MKIHNITFIVLGIIGLILIGGGQYIVKKPNKNVSSHIRFFNESNILSSQLNNRFKNIQSTNNTNSSEKIVAILVIIIGLILVIIGSAFYAAGKNRSKWFGLLGLLAPVGFLFLAVLEDKTPIQELPENIK